MQYFNYNGRTLEAATPIVVPDNRGLRYGDGLFETMKYANGKLVLMDEHFARLWKGMQLFLFEIPKLFTPDHLQEQVLALVKKNGSSDARVRISVIRGNGGLYDSKNIPEYIIQSWSIPVGAGALNENGLQMGIYRDARKITDTFSNCKHNNFLPYLMGALFAKNNKYNDAIILNNHDRICDSTIANVFLVKNGSLITPALTEGCVAGVIRKFLLQTLPPNGISINEAAVTEEQLMDADEVFLTNSILNMRWVSAIESKSYTCKMTRDIFELITKKYPTVFC